MNAAVKPPAETLPQWRLDDLYAGREDPGIELDLEGAAKINGELATLKGAFVAARQTPAKLGELIDRGIGLYQAATDKLWAVGAYAGLAASIARDDPAWARFEGRHPHPLVADRRRQPVLHPGAERAGGRRDRGGAESPSGGGALATLAAPGAAVTPARTQPRPGAAAARPRPGRCQLGAALRRDPGYPDHPRRPRGPDAVRGAEPLVGRRTPPAASPPPRASPAPCRPRTARWRWRSTPWRSRSRWKTAGVAIRRRPPAAMSPMRSTPRRWRRWRRRWSPATRASRTATTR